MQALEDLDYLAALDDDGNLSEVGIIMSEFPLDPELAKALIASCEFDCVEEMVSLAAMLTGTAPRGTAEPALAGPVPGARSYHPCVSFPVSPCFVPPSTHLEEAATLRRRTLLHPHGDHFTLINVFNAFQQRECQRVTRPQGHHSSSLGPLLLLGASAAATSVTLSWLQGSPGCNLENLLSAWSCQKQTGLG